VAVVTWLVTAPLALILARRTDVNPMTEQGAFIPLAAGGLLLVIGGVLAFVSKSRSADWLSATAAGLFGAWVAYSLQIGLTGTPFGYAGLQSDNGRMTASAVRYSATIWSSDTFVEDVPSEYPPLFPWVVGRASLLVDVPAWRLVAPAEVLLLSLAVVLGFLLWQRLVPAPVALVCSAITPVVYGVPFKPFTIVALVVLVPWVIASFTDPPRGRLHWLPAGVVGGLIVLTYHGWITFAAVGIIAVMVGGWRRATDRRGYARHVLLTILVATVVSSPYVVPYGYALLTTDGGQPLSDLALTAEITDTGFPFLEPTILGLLQLAGLVGLVWLRRQVFWAWPMLYLVLGAYVFWLVFGIRFVLTGHTTMFYYTARVNGEVLALAGILTVAHVARLGVQRGLRPPRGVGATVVALTLLFSGYSYWQEWRPRPAMLSTQGDFSVMAHLEPGPDCSFPQYKPDIPWVGCLPVNGIRGVVQRVRPEGDRPHTLSGDERLFSFLPWRAYMAVDRNAAGTLTRFDDRLAELVRLSEITDPDEFARASADTEFGPIDVFVIGRVDEGRRWGFLAAEFRPRQFDPSMWEIVDRPEWPVVVIVRR
jgi:hypothetical protein